MLYLFACLFAALTIGQIDAAVPYMQATSTIDQQVSAENVDKPIIVIMDRVDWVSNIGWDPKTYEVTVKEGGVYFLMAVAQIGVSEAATKLAPSADIFLWLEVNNAPVQGGGDWISSTVSAAAKTIVNQVVIPLKAGDKLRYKFCSTAANYGFVSYPGQTMRSDAPGITFSMYKVG